MTDASATTMIGRARAESLQEALRFRLSKREKAPASLKRG
jgi:hypothetical protein